MAPNCELQLSVFFGWIPYVDSLIFRPCDRPRIIESLRGKEIIDVTCGGAHSAAITASGELYTWGKGRYGRLGHGDSDDQLKPKLVEALLGTLMTTLLIAQLRHDSFCYRLSSNGCCLWIWRCSDIVHH